MSSAPDPRAWLLRHLPPEALAPLWALRRAGASLCYSAVDLGRPCAPALWVTLCGRTLHAPGTPAALAALGALGFALHDRSAWFATPPLSAPSCQPTTPTAERSRESR